LSAGQPPAAALQPPSEELRCWQQQQPSEALLSGAPAEQPPSKELHVATPAERGAVAAERRTAEQTAAGVERGAAVRGAAL